MKRDSCSALKTMYYRKKLLVVLQNVLYTVIICRFLESINLGDRFPWDFLLLLSGDIETNPGPQINKCLKFFHWNLNSICARGNVKIPLIEAYDSIYKNDIIAISESMLDSTIGNEEICIEGYSKEIYRNDHPSNTKTGGVCLYFREGLPIKRRTDLELLQEMIVAEITFARKKIFFITVYRSPSQTSDQFEEFINQLQATLDQLRRERYHSLVLTGDFNCRSSQWWDNDVENPEGTALDELMEMNNLYQLIDEPTNIRGEGMSCIDLIITDQPNMFVESGVHPSLDEHCQHQLIYGKLNYSLPTPPPYKRTIWDYSKADTGTIRDILNCVDWNSRFNGLGSEEMAEVFTSALHSTLSSHIPNKIIKCNDKDPPWITPELKSAIKRKHRVYRKFVQRGRRQEDWNLVKETRNRTSKMIIHEKESYYLHLGRKLSDPNQGIKTYWATLNRLINKKKVSNIPPLLENGLFVTNVQTKANILNDYFVKQCCMIATGSSLPNFRPRCNSVLENMNIDREKVLQLIRALDSKKASGCDNISVFMIKICDSSIVEPLCLIFEKCLETGIYPSVWKKANIIPVHKKESRQNKKNYRPISLLPIFGKVFEKILFDGIYGHLNENGLITSRQSGFRPGDSTINQLLSITHKIYSAFEEIPSHETRAVFLDLSKAFDRVWHEGLLYKLQCSGIDGNLLSLIRNYLANRKQRVVLNGKSSQWASISAGVPQGSVLGPLFFLVYINDLVDNVHSDARMFADDTSLFSVVNEVNRTAEDLNRDLETVRLWAWQWKMQFNADKTEEVIFSCKRRKPSHPPLSLGSNEIDTKSEHKHLGLTLDSKLNFESHIREASLKARRGIGMIKYLSKYVSRNVLDQIYKLYVRPHLDYGDIIYHRYDPEMQSAFTQRLEHIQYSAALAVTGAWRGTSRQRLYEELGWENLYQRRWYRRLCHFFNVKKSQSPHYLFAEIPDERELTYNLRATRAYNQNFGRTVRFSNTYFQNTLFEWNLLCDDIKHSVSIAEFKRKLLAAIRPLGNSTYNIHDIDGVRSLTKLRLNFSALNEHRFRHNFDCLNPICSCGTGKEDNEHYLLHCPEFDLMRADLFGHLSEIPALDINDMDTTALCNLLLYGSSHLNIISNRMIMDATILYIKTTQRFK